MPDVRGNVREVRRASREIRRRAQRAIGLHGDLAGRIDAVGAATREEGAAARQAAAALAETVEGHVQGLIEITDHLSVRLDRAILLLERIESRLSELEDRSDPDAVRHRA